LIDNLKNTISKQNVGYVEIQETIAEIGIKLRDSNDKSILSQIYPEIFKMMSKQGATIQMDNIYSIILKDFIHIDPKISTLLVSEYMKLESFEVAFTVFLIENNLIDLDEWDWTFA